MTVFDGKGTPDVMAKGIRSAIADQADGIILDVVDCAAVKSPLEEAKQAGIKIFAHYSLDCDDPLLGGNGEPLFDAEIVYEEGLTYAEQVEDRYSKSVADYVIAETDGQAKVIQFVEDDILVAQHLYKGFAKHLEACEGCEIVKQVPFTLTDLATGQLQGKATAALTQNPDANVVYVPYDAALTLGIAQAVTASGRDDELLVTGGEGLSPNVGFVREGKGQDMIAGAPARWVGWAAVDGMNRLLQDEPQVDAGIGFQTLDSESALPTETTFYDGNLDENGKPKQDYEANYRKIWGLS
jgi:ribose transport system substrate-binding protein